MKVPLTLQISAAAAAVVVVAATAAAAVVAAAAAENHKKNNNPGTAVVAKKAIVTHNKFPPLNDYITYYANGGFWLLNSLSFFRPLP